MRKWLRQATAGQFDYPWNWPRQLKWLTAFLGLVVTNIALWVYLPDYLSSLNLPMEAPLVGFLTLGFFALVSGADVYAIWSLFSGSWHNAGVLVAPLAVFMALFFGAMSGTPDGSLTASRIAAGAASGGFFILVIAASASSSKYM